MDITVDEIESFVAIAQTGGFTGASRKLNRSQPAISRRIHQLEQTLQAALFERAGRRVSLTEAGKALLPHAESALSSIRDGERAVRDAAGRPQGAFTLNLAVVGTLADSHLVDVLREFRLRFRDATVGLRTATSQEVSRLVRNGEASLGLRYYGDGDGKLEAFEVGWEKVYVVVPWSHRVHADRLPNLVELKDEQWLGFPQDRRRPESYRQLLDAELLAAGCARPAITPVDSLTAQKRLVEAGMGLALMPMSSVREEVQVGSLRVIEIDSLRVGLPVVVVRRKGGYQSRLAEVFVELLIAGDYWNGRPD